MSFDPMRAASELEAADTELADLDAKIVESISAARVHNRQRKEFEQKRDELRSKVQPLREAVARHLIEQKRIAGERAKAEAEARAKVEAEAKANELTELQKKDAEIAALKEQLAAKG